MSNMTPYTKPVPPVSPVFTGPGPVIPGMAKILQGIKDFKAITIALSCVQVALCILPLISVIMEMTGNGSKVMRVISLISLLLLLGASLAKLITTSLFWSTTDARYIFPAVLS
jgi:hypothetical protein